jgi:O-antigen ligase
LLAIRGKNTLQTLLRGKFLLILIALVPLSVLWSDFPDITMRRSIAFIETCAFSLYLASRYSLKEQLKLLAWAVGIAIILSFIYTIILPEHAIETGIHTGSWRGPFVQKNILARLVVLGCLIFILIKPQKRIYRYLLISAFGLSITLVFLANSKTALAILIILLLLIPFYQVFRWQDTIAIPFFLSIFLLASCLTVWLVSSADEILTVAGKDITLSGRTIIWSAVIDKIQERIWLGYGYEGFWQGIQGASEYIAKVFGTTYAPPHSHNGFLELALAFGLLGTVFFFFTFIGTTRRALIAARYTKDLEGLWPLMYLSFLLFYNLLESTLLKHNSIFWIIYVALVFSRYLEIEEYKSTPVSSSQEQISSLIS